MSSPNVGDIAARSRRHWLLCGPGVGSVRSRVFTRENPIWPPSAPGHPQPLVARIGAPRKSHPGRQVCLTSDRRHRIPFGRAFRKTRDVTALDPVRQVACVASCGISMDALALCLRASAASRPRRPPNPEGHGAPCHLQHRSVVHAPSELRRPAEMSTSGELFTRENRLRQISVGR